MALAYASKIAKNPWVALPENADQLPALLLQTSHPGFLSQPQVGLTAQTVLQHQATPLINLAILDRAGKRGIVGQGIYSPPLALFEQAMGCLNSLE